ncbi:hypothetical protein ACFQDE_16015 [Deinococcus caeni]|uniref:Uncharacterized protein n=1 Tax=Deinococcus caeni TaxID=569127 RepID=A0ABP9U9V9_9DEIO
MKTLKTITDLSQVPTFRTLAQEAAFWDGHQLAPALWAESQRGDAELDQALNGLVSVKVISSRPADLKGKGQPSRRMPPAAARRRMS